MLARYAAAGITRSMSPHKWRHFLFTWLKKQGIDDALIQPYSGHESRESLEIYSRLSIAEAQQHYNQAMGSFPSSNERTAMQPPPEDSRTHFAETFKDQRLADA